ncbi:acyltransferase [Aerococcus agrisoli]|uniref:Acyltransferase n=1 Tax=Aerococcus agrisoli TaxID=2487350 RepID=A0A3N4G519_9LACT|nr:acyltransferase family protein [Aerococcus agrisoli]RPA57973.1 acyltransferase [Aerococcus agrisoli]
MKKKLYYTQFDTIRFFAMLAIILYHYLTHRVSGGFLGVDVFLVLSGFLVTSQMEAKYEQGIKEPYFKKLWSRIRKLWWPMLIISLIGLTFLLLFRRQLLVNIGINLASSLLFMNNWHQIFSGSSYFANMLHPSIMTHYWYVAVYMQFMVIWPIFYGLSRRFTKSKQQSGWVMLGAAVLSAILMAVLFKPGADPSRVYYGTDTRFFSIALGGAAAQLIDVDVLNKKLSDKMGRWGHWVIDLLLVALLGILTWATMHLTDSQPLTYYGGMFAFNALSGILIALLTFPGSWVAYLLKFKPLRWLGQRTFHMYLWYYPINVLFHMVPTSQNWFTGSIWPQILLIMVLACLSYALLEEKRWTVPIFNQARNEKPGHVVSQLKQVFKKQTPILTKVLFVAFVSIFIGGATAVAISKPAENVTVEEKAAADQAKKIEEQNKKRAEQAKKADQGLAAYKQDLTAEQLAYYEGIPAEQARFAYQLPVTFVGDSLMVGASDGLYTLFPNAIVDAVVGRQMYKMAGYMTSLAEQGMLADTVVVDLGANGGFTQDQLNAFLDEIGRDKNIFLINSHVDRPWTADVNATLAKAAADESDSVYLLDWHSYFANDENASSWLGTDGVHFNPEGDQIWLQFVTNGIYQILGKS